VVYPALLKLMRTPRLPAVDWTDALTDLNGLVRLGERRNLLSARVPSRSARAIRRCVWSGHRLWGAKYQSIVIELKIGDMRFISGYNAHRAVNTVHLLHETSLLMLYKVKFAFCFQIHKKHMNAMWVPCVLAKHCWYEGVLISP